MFRQKIEQIDSVKQKICYAENKKKCLKNYIKSGPMAPHIGLYRRLGKWAVLNADFSDILVNFSSVNQVIVLLTHTKKVCKISA